jgi:hypothetical protein
VAGNTDAADTSNAVRWLFEQYDRIDRIYKPAIEAHALCRTLGDGSLCLLGSTRRNGWNCCVCSSVLRWRRGGYTHVVVRELDGGTGAEVIPARSEDIGRIPNCVLQLDFQRYSHEDVRRVVNTVLGAIRDIWLYDEQSPGPAFVCIRSAEASRPAPAPLQSD